MRNEGLERVLTLIVDKLNANATVTSGLLSMRGQVVFAVKTGLDGKLDAMRNVYNSLIDEIEGKVIADQSRLSYYSTKTAKKRQLLLICATTLNYYHNCNIFPTDVQHV